MGVTTRTFRGGKREAQRALAALVVEAERGSLARAKATVGELLEEWYAHASGANLHPADAALNLPDQLHSHGLRRLAAVESTRGSFDEAAAAIERGTGVAVAERQVES